jgi:hypothetical protein
MRIALALASVSLALASTARADGVYFTQNVGVGNASGELESMVGRTLRTRAGLGARVGYLAIEGWLAAHVQAERVNNEIPMIGGDPPPGRADLEQYGVDVKAIAPLHRTRDITAEGYLRLGAGIVSGTGELDDQRGYQLGAGGGLQIRGRVRVLGFLWGPLFFLNKGPKITAALFVDHGHEWVVIERGAIEARLSALTIGFAVGSSF